MVKKLLLVLFLMFLVCSILIACTEKSGPIEKIPLATPNGTQLTTPPATIVILPTTETPVINKSPTVISTDTTTPTLQPIPYPYPYPAPENVPLPFFTPTSINYSLDQLPSITNKNAARLQVLKTFDVPGSIESVAISPDSSLVAFGTDENGVENGKAYLGDLVSGEIIKTFDMLTWTTGVKFSPDRGQLIIGDSSSLYYYDLMNYLLVRQIMAHVRLNGQMLTFALSPTQPIAVTSSSDHLIRIWELNSGRLLVSLREEDAVSDIAFSPDGSLILFATGDGFVQVSDTLKAGKPLNSFGGKVVAFNEKGNLLVAGNSVIGVR